MITNRVTRHFLSYIESLKAQNTFGGIRLAWPLSVKVFQGKYVIILKENREELLNLLN